ncbi:MAG TPA: hypothetical protein PK580_09360 [Nitrosomonas halophila]|nr:hypothetical protein [Nitrosomonas halophila]
MSLLPAWNWLAGRYLPCVHQQADIVHAAGQITTLALGLSLALGGCPRIAIVARAKLTERNFSII